MTWDPPPPRPQVLIYTEDFRWERADRERAQERIQSLQDQLARLQQELHVQVNLREANHIVLQSDAHRTHTHTPK